MNTNIFINNKDLISSLNQCAMAYAPSLDPNVINSPNYQPIAQKSQLGFLPIFYYKIDFRIGKKE